MSLTLLSDSEDSPNDWGVFIFRHINLKHSEFQEDHFMLTFILILHLLLSVPVSLLPAVIGDLIPLAELKAMGIEVSPQFIE